jgi:hypothetical protein
LVVCGTARRLGWSCVGLHLIVAQHVSNEILAAMAQREQHPTINGRAEPEPTARDLLNAPPPLE